MYKRSSVGGNISSANGVIKSFRNNGYKVDVLTDDIVPGLESEQNKINFIFYSLSRFRFILMKLSFINFFGNFFQKLENYTFKKIMRHKVNKLLQNEKYEYCYVRASPHLYALKDLIQKFKIELIVEVNKPLSMTPYNKDGAVNWPKTKKEVYVTDAEIIQYDIAKMITVDSTLRAQWILDFVGDYKNKILINHNGVDINNFTPSEKKVEILNSYAFKPQDIVVGMASSFRWYNDLDELFEIIKKTNKKNNLIKFLIISGNKKKGDEINTHINKNNLSNFVKLSVQIPFKKMPEVLNVCDICLSHFNFNKKWPHNCSIKHLEYLAMAKPVVATDVGEVNFAVEDGINGFLCKEGNINEHVNAILTLAKDNDLRQKFGKNGFEKATSNLTWDENIQRILYFASTMN